MKGSDLLNSINTNDFKLENQQVKLAIIKSKLSENTWHCANDDSNEDHPFALAHGYNKEFDLIIDNPYDFKTKIYLWLTVTSDAIVINDILDNQGMELEIKDFETILNKFLNYIFHKLPILKNSTFEIGDTYILPVKTK